jgi:transposase InsO family protein
VNKNELNRLVAWRLKLLREADEMPRGVAQTCRHYGLSRNTFYQWKARYIHLFNDKLQEWEDYYNYHRPHGALDGQTPYERLLARKASAGVSPKS